MNNWCLKRNRKSNCRSFHKQGAIVILTDISNYEGTIVAELLGEKSEYYELDVKKESDWIEISKTIKTKYGKLDILVNNAGITGFLETNNPFDAEKLAEYRHGNCRKPKEEIAKALRLVVGLAKRSYDPKPHRACGSTDEYHKTLFNENQFNTPFSIPIIITTTTV